MDLPIIQYKKHRVAYIVSACIGLGAICFGYFPYVRDNHTSVGGWILMGIGLLTFIGCSWSAIDKSIVLELNHEGIKHKAFFYGWDTLRSYSIRKEIAESGSFNYLVLHLKTSDKQLDIQLDWLEDHESVPEKMAMYAGAFHISFDGVTRKEV